MEQFVLKSCIRGYHHIYKNAWTSSIGEMLDYEREAANNHDPYVVALKKNADIVDHVPHSISCIYTLFLRHGGNIKSTVTGHQRLLDDLPHGGLELPCGYKFIGPNNLTLKAYQLLADEGNDADELQSK